MEAVLDWIKRLLYFSVFLTVFMQLLPGESYKKYVRFFAGILLIILAVNPVLTFLSKENFADGILESIAESEETVDMELDMDELQQAQQNYYRYQAEQAVKEVVKEQAEQMELTVGECDVIWSENGEQIASITVKFSGKEEEEKDETGQSDASQDSSGRTITQDDGSDVERVDIDRTVIEQIQINTGKKDQEDEMQESLSDGAERLKKELMQTLELSEDQVHLIEQ